MEAFMWDVIDLAEALAWPAAMVWASHEARMAAQGYFSRRAYGHVK